METNLTKITVGTSINAPIEKAWKLWTTAEDVVKWNTASEDWHTTKAEIDLRVGGKFTYRMEAKDGSVGFDFYGFYEKIETNSIIEILLGDDRKVHISFTSKGSGTVIYETFEAENENSIELQKHGWQCILDNFKKYVENKLQ